MTSTLLIIISLSILGLISYLIYLIKKNPDTEEFDINENPEFLRLQGQHEANLKEIALKEKFIEELKNDKQALRDSVKNVDEFLLLFLVPRFPVLFLRCLEERVLLVIGTSFTLNMFLAVTLPSDSARRLVNLMRVRLVP